MRWLLVLLMMVHVPWVSTTTCRARPRLFIEGWALILVLQTRSARTIAWLLLLLRLSLVWVRWNLWLLRCRIAIVRLAHGALVGWLGPFSSWFLRWSLLVSLVNRARLLWSARVVMDQSLVCTRASYRLLQVISRLSVILLLSALVDLIALWSQHCIASLFGGVPITNWWSLLSDLDVWWAKEVNIVVWWGLIFSTSSDNSLDVALGMLNRAVSLLRRFLRGGHVLGYWRLLVSVIIHTLSLL